MSTTPDDDSHEDGPDPREEAADQVEALARANAASNATLLRLVDRVREDAHMRERKVELLEEGQTQTRKLLVLVSAVLAALVIIGIINAVNIHDTRQNAATVAATANDAQRTYTLLLGCLDVNEPCGKNGAERTKESLEEIKLYELTVLYCVRINPLVQDPGGDKFLECVNRLYPGGPQLKDR